MTTKEAFAGLLTGREYRQEITKVEELQAKSANLLVIFGASDDLTEMRGALTDEAGAWDGATHRIDREGFVPGWESVEHTDIDACREFFRRENAGVEVHARWSKDDYSWIIETDMPHATFEIVEGDEKYCRGIVIDMADLPT